MSESYPIITPRDDGSTHFHITKFLTSNTPKFSSSTVLLKPKAQPRPKLKAYINLAKKSKKEKEALLAAHNVEIDPKDLKWRMEDKKNKRSYIGEPEVIKEQGSQYALLILKNNEFIFKPVDFLQFRPEATYRVMTLEEAESEMKSRKEGKRWKDRITLLDKAEAKDKKDKLGSDDYDVGNSKDEFNHVKKEIDDESAFVEYGEGTTEAKQAAKRRNKEAAIDFREKFDDDEEDEAVSDRDYSEEEEEPELPFSAPTKAEAEAQKKKEVKEEESSEEDEDESEGEEFDENESLSDSSDEDDKKKDTKKGVKRGREDTATTNSAKKVKTEEGHAPLPTGSALEEVLDVQAERAVLEKAIRNEFALNGNRGMTIIELTSRLKNKVANLNATRKKIIVGIVKEITRLQQDPVTKASNLFLK